MFSDYSRSMPRFSANLSLLYTELPFAERFAAAAADGFEAVEYIGAYDMAPDAVAELLQANGLTQALFNFPAGDWAAGDRGLACLPDRRDEFRESVDTAIAYATATGCLRLNCLAGIAPQDHAREALEDVLAENLRFAAGKLAAAGIRLLLEPINPVDMPGYLVNSTDDFERIAALVGHDNLYLQYDFYHMQRVQGGLLENFERLQDRIAHVQISDVPGRHEPGSGEIDYEAIFAMLDRLGYDGWVGAEYHPAGTTSAGLGWFGALETVGGSGPLDQLHQ
jgi:hydroxypyruvate isomerase